MGLLTDQKARNKLEYNNAVEESPLVHIDSEQESKSLDVDSCTPKTFSALNITKVHELVPRCFLCPPSTCIYRCLLLYKPYFCLCNPIHSMLVQTVCGYQCVPCECVLYTIVVVSCLLIEFVLFTMVIYPT